MTYKLHKQFNWHSSSARLRKPTQQERVMRMLNKLQAAKAKSNVGPKLTIVKDSDNHIVSWSQDSGWKDAN